MERFETDTLELDTAEDEGELDQVSPYGVELIVPDSKDHHNYELVLKLNDNLLAVQAFQERGEPVPEGFLTRRESLLNQLTGDTATQILEEFKLRLHKLMRQAA